VTDSRPEALGTGEFLTVRVGTADGVPERLLLIGRPHDGLVHVKEWTSNTAITAGEDYEIPPAELLEQLEQAFQSRRAMSEEMYRIRLWLG
jgi:hypothetical protein